MAEARGDTLGLLLAGGLSRRMGGQPKGLIDLNGKSLIERVRARAEPQVNALVLNSSLEPNPYSGLALPLVRDLRDGFQGPLAGIEAGLTEATKRGLAWLVTFPCDSPLVPTDLAQRLHAAVARDGSEVVLAKSNGRDCPVAGLWSTAVLGRLSAFLDAEQRKVDAFTATLTEARCDFSRPDHDPFFNINRPEDLTEAERLTDAEDLIR